MALIIGTQIQCRAVVARLNTRLGYPRAAQESDRVGGGVHVPLAQAGTARAAYVIELSSGAYAVRIPDALVAQLTAAQQALVAARLPDGVTIVNNDRD